MQFPRSNKDTFFGVSTDTPLLTGSPWMKDVMMGYDQGRKRSTSESRSTGSQENDPVISWDSADYHRFRSQAHRQPSSIGPSLPTTSTTSTTGSSIASSDISDPYIDFDLDLSSESSALFNQISFDSDLLGSSSLMPILEGCSITDNPVLGVMSWSDSELDIHDTPCHSSRPTVMTSMPSSPRAQRKHSQSPSNLSSASPTAWSQMTEEEQKAYIKNLTDVISTEMDLREQLDIIKIISPLSRISPTATEFFITLESLDDEKVAKIREAMGRHERNTIREHCAELRFSISKSSSKKRMSRAQSRELRQRQRKEHRQAVKEQKSGLFRREEVLPLKNLPTFEEDSDDDEVDILT